ncbi:unnamed protein product [Darwinula stevensoni]|uniref:Uncharacterized protein n=1 Tax=Darwinula stevensoni TaxID=69355 RepID=A0A7R8XE04_9CRUS|nr:unnamed protein product [Darwinula stevensoni]CAG0890140.1 unnamed protein product [Darwinula stevensoni]
MLKESVCHSRQASNDCLTGSKLFTASLLRGDENPSVLGVRILQCSRSPRIEGGMELPKEKTEHDGEQGMGAGQNGTGKREIRQSRLLRFCILFLVVLLTVSMMLSFIKRYRDTPTNTSIEIEEVETLRAPLVTICQSPSFRKPQDGTHDNDTFSKLVRDFAFPLKDVVGSFSINKAPMKEGLKDKPDQEIIETQGGTWSTRYILDESEALGLQRCFTFNASILFGVMDRSSGLFLRLDMDNATERDAGFDAGWDVLIHQDLDYPSLIDGFYTKTMVKPRTTQDIQLMVRIIQNIPTPKNPCIQDLQYSKEKMEYRVQIVPPLQQVNTTWVFIYAPSKNVELLTEKEVYDISQMVGEMGGCVGMFLGVSLISLYELLDSYIRLWTNPLQMLSYIKRYRDTPTIISVEIEEVETLRAPLVTICQSPSFRKPQDGTHDNDTFSKLVRDFAFPLKDVVASFSINKAPMKEGLKDKPDLEIIETQGGTWSTRYILDESEALGLQRCFTLNASILFGVMDRSSGLFLRLDMDNAAERDAGFDAGWDVLIHEDLDYPSLIDGFYTKTRVKPRTTQDIQLTARQVRNIVTPKNRCIRHLQYSKEKCLDECILRAMKESSSCRLPWMTKSDFPPCETKMEMMATVKAYEKLARNGKYKRLNCSCPMPCSQVEYRVQIVPPLQHANTTWVFIYLPSRKIEILREKEAYDISQMVGEVGGCVGMFLGVSLISVYELLDHYIRLWMSRRAPPS